MIAVISPAKTLDFEKDCPAHEPTVPEYLDQSSNLVGILRKKSRGDLMSLMSISEKLADLNFDRYQNWQTPFTEDNARAALLAFKGDVYTGFELDGYGKKEFKYAQKHLRILSGLYGLLRPLDLIQPYRLEMGTKLNTPLGKDLYSFWGDQITEGLNTSLSKSGSDVLVNLASKEYFTSVRKPALKAGRIITPDFKDWKNGKYKIISFYAKKARGMMCDFMTQNGITDPKGLKDFRTAGYSFNSELSEGDNWVFTRKEASS